MQATARETSYTIAAVGGQVRWLLSWLLWSGASVVVVRIARRYVEFTAVAVLVSASCQSVGHRIKQRVFSGGAGLGPGPVTFSIATSGQRPPALTGRQSLVDGIDLDRVRQLWL